MFKSLPKQKGTLDNHKPDMFLKTKYFNINIEKGEINRKEINMINTKTSYINFN